MNYILPAIALSVLAAGCHQKTETVAESKHAVCISDSLSKIIQIDSARTSSMKSELSLSGEVSYNDNRVVKVFPFASGQVLDVKVSLGDKVSKGQTLAVLRSADVAGNYSDLASARADLEVARRAKQQAEYLYKSGISSEREYTDAKENYNKAQAAMRKVQEQISINGGGNTSANGIYYIKAPESGYIVEKNISAGNFLRTDNNGSLFTISDMKDVWIWANVFESDIAKVKKGYSAKITTLAYPGKTFEGKVDEVSSVLDPENKVLKVRISLPNKDYLLKPEMFTDVLITSDDNASKCVCVPSSAVIFDNSKNFVVVYNGKCDLQIREVSVIKTVENVTYLASGLKPGDRLITKNQILIFNALAEG